jgi:microcystin-dependent protein
MFAGATAPAGWLLCQGQSLTATNTVYSSLFAAIGYTYGGSAGTFQLPDLRSSFAQGAGTAPDTLGSKGGSNAATTVNHTHTTASHQHTINIQYSTTTTTGGTAYRVTDVLNAAGGGGTAASAGSVGSGALTTGGPSVATGTDGRPSYVTINYIIKL